MFNSHLDVFAYHNDEVTLRLSDRTAMRDRRNSNRDRLKARLRDAGKPSPWDFIKQGSYAMKSMVQDFDNDYDIDDGVYFTQESLRDKQGNDMAPKAARQMVCDALKDGRFARDPVVKTSCVRIFYEEGYHVDMPVYRVVIAGSGERYELACGDSWVESRAADVEEWFDRENERLSPDETNGRQLRRMVRFHKKYSRSRNKWKDQVAAGFTITKLVQELLQSHADREDWALRETMRAIHSRLQYNLEVDHPVTPNAKLTDGPNDPKTRFFRERLGESLEKLQVLDNYDCTAEQAAEAWDDVFDTTFFSRRIEKTARARVSNASLIGNLLSDREQPRQFEKSGGGRFA